MEGGGGPVSSTITAQSSLITFFFLSSCFFRLLRVCQLCIHRLLPAPLCGSRFFLPPPRTLSVSAASNRYPKFLFRCFSLWIKRHLHPALSMAVARSPRLNCRRTRPIANSLFPKIISSSRPFSFLALTGVLSRAFPGDYDVGSFFFPPLS